MDADKMSTFAKDGLIANFKAVAAQVEDLLRNFTDGGGDKFTAASARVGEALQEARLNLETAQNLIVNNTREAARTTDQYVHDHPWRAIGIAAGIGLIAGLLMRR
ncbi:MAG: DUF883 domain-containing protein [Burkholderiales bacterium]|nr:DUF883 domain-containing protein [Burkholderiales bacterium]